VIRLLIDVTSIAASLARRTIAEAVSRQVLPQSSRTVTHP
jgi:hypothetical protein